MCVRDSISVDIMHFLKNTILNTDVFSLIDNSKLILSDSNILKKNDWDVAEDNLNKFLSSLYVNDSTLKSQPDSMLCQDIVNYYLLNNPTDGFLSEILSMTIYNLYYDNGILCLYLDSFMQKKMMPQELQDTIWSRIAENIRLYIFIEEDDGVTIIDRQRHFPFFVEHGYL